MLAVPAIESPANPLIREIARSLEDRTHLLLEGEKTILEAVAAGIALEHLLHDASIKPGRLAALTGAHPRLVSRAVLERIADTRTPQHLLAVARRRDVPVAEILSRSGPVVFLFGIQDPGNLGAIVRVAEAAGAAGVLGAPGTADFFHPRAVRASAGSVLRIPVSGRVSFEPFAARREGRRPRRLRRRRRRRRGPVLGAARPALGPRDRGRRRRAAGRRLPLPRAQAHDPDAGAGGLFERRRCHGAAAVLPFPEEGEGRRGGLNPPPRGPRGATIFFCRLPVPFIPRTPPRRTPTAGRRRRATRRAPARPCGRPRRGNARRRIPTPRRPAAAGGPGDPRARE